MRLSWLVAPILFGPSFLACDEGADQQGQSFELERETDTRMVPRTETTPGQVGTEGNSEQLDEQQDNPLDPGPDGVGTTPSEEGAAGADQ